MNPITVVAHKVFRRAKTGLLVIVLASPIAGCDGAATGPDEKTAAELINTIMRATPNPASPEQVAEAFALGSHFTDLQRDMIKDDLIGSLVEWDIRVYEVNYSDGRYTVTSQPFSIKSNSAIPLIRTVALIQAQDARDHALLQSIKTDDVLRIRGLVQSITLRTVITVGPAVLAWPR